MKILVTGSSGFIGKNTMIKLLELGHDVTGIDINPKIIKGEALHNLKIKQYDFNAKHIHSKLKGYDAVVHLAALGGVPMSLREPKRYWEGNINVFNNLIEACREWGVKRFIYASSSSVKQMKSPYAVTKKFNELVGKIYAESFGMETIGLRLHNVTGRWQRPDSVLPIFVRSIRDGGEVNVNGNLEISRDFTSVHDVTDAIVCALGTDNENAFGNTYDIGRGESITLESFINDISVIMDSEVNINIILARFGDINKSLADPKPAFDDLEFFAHRDIEFMIKDYLLTEVI